MILPHGNIFLALVHFPALDRGGRIVSTSITNLDIHDFSRLARTYALGGVFLVSPVPDQEALVGKIIGHWRDGAGRAYNPTRHEALAIARVVPDIAAAREEIARTRGGEPLLFATSARFGTGTVPPAAVAESAASRPALVLFGTGFGLAASAVEACDAKIAGIPGADGYNHLSVRAAAAILVDRMFMREGARD